MSPLRLTMVYTVWGDHRYQLALYTRSGETKCTGKSSINCPRGTTTVSTEYGIYATVSTVTSALNLHKSPWVPRDCGV